MKTEQLSWNQASGWQPGARRNLGESAQLVLLFGGRALLKEGAGLAALASAYPNAMLFGCSTSGEILDTHVNDDSIVATAISFDTTKLRFGLVKLSDTTCSLDAGQKLASLLEQEGLIHALVLSDGLGVNGSDLVRGIVRRLPPNVTLTGGLAGDGANFEQTVVVFGGKVESGSVAIVGFYGDSLEVGCASMGGWDPFGPDRVVTKSEGNVLYELDGRSALELYKQYLGEHADGLPGTGLLFPLSVRSNNDSPGLVRAFLAVNDDGSLVFAGDVPIGSYARLMRANCDHLIDGASGAALKSLDGIDSKVPELSLLISCVARKLVLKQRVEEEVEAVRDIVGTGSTIAGFYSYGEISPFEQGASCELHNQTMTITTFRER